MYRNRSLSDQANRVLGVLAERPADWRHGYALSKATGLSSGTLYPLLIRLDERGLLEARWEPSETVGKPPRHAYRLTSAGAALARQSGESPRAVGQIGKAIPT